MRRNASSLSCSRSSRALRSPRAPPREAAAGVAIEPTWKTVVLATGRVVANGRFDAARACYHAERAEKKAAAEAELARRLPVRVREALTL